MNTIRIDHPRLIQHFAGLLFFFMILPPWSGYGQYFGERVMEKSFEQMDFFFTPNRLTPFGIGSYKNSVTGLLDDPFLNLDLNPAFLFGSATGSSTIYFDFRSAKEMHERRDMFFPYHTRDIFTTERVSEYFAPYPHFYVNTRKELEPVISIGYLFRPTSGTLKNLSLGLTYQRLSQNEEYYPIPQDIYRSVMGYDYNGIRSASAESIPIIDKYSGTDNIHHKGDFLTLYTGYEVDPSLQLGVKIGHTNFDRSGSLGSQNLWESYYSAGNSSLWRNREARDQSYRHWEVIGGIHYRFDSLYSIGLTGGRVWGDVEQNLTRDDYSTYGYGPYGSRTENWYQSLRSGIQHQNWVHDGKTDLGGINLKAQLNSTQLLQVHYFYSRQNVALGLRSSINDTSHSQYHAQWDTVLYTSFSNYSVRDYRNGDGSTIAGTHRVVASLTWDISATTRLYIGAQYQSRRVDTRTSEQVFANRHSRYASSGYYPYSYFDSTAEAKSLQWDFRTRLRQVTIPVILTHKLSDVVELMFGLNRTTADWQVNDVTLALIDYRVSANPDTVIRRGMFGERYTQPEENVSDVRTTVLFGLKVSPSSVFSIQLLVVPSFVNRYEGTELENLQTWIALSLTP
jgi:hypothetical protein